jgi:Kef-type K+ transport system membrane component KefB
MTPFLQLALTLVIIISAAKLGGYISYRIGQPAVLGELIFGIILGPSLINFLDKPYFTNLHLPEMIHYIAEVGVMLLMFLAALELRLLELIHSSKVSALAGTLGVIFPLILGTITGIVFALDIQPAIFFGLIISATSVSISAQTLMELKVLRSRVGVSLLGAAVFDDILVLLVLSVFVALTQPISGEIFPNILGMILKMIFFLGISSAIGLWLIPRLSRLISNLPISQGLIAFTFVCILLYGWAAETVGQFAAITGAFLAGLWFGRISEKERIHNGIATIAYGIFVPVFFINVGLSANARDIGWEGSLLLLVMLFVAVISKVLGSGLGAIIGGFTRREALQLGVGMMSRGEVGLIVATLGIEQGFIQADIFSAVVGVLILTTLLTPLLLRMLFPKVQTVHAKTLKATEGE